MPKSFTYHLLSLAIKIKGLKKVFCQTPINYLQLRKSDVYSPKNSYFRLKNVTTFFIAKTKITEIANGDKSIKLLIYIHGGAFVSGPAQHH